MASDDPSDPYVDMHAWQFTPASFELLLLELARLRKTDWQIQRTTPAMGCEFHAWLCRGGKAAAGALSQSRLDARRLVLLKQCLLQTSEQIDFLLAGDRRLMLSKGTGPRRPNWRLRKPNSLPSRHQHPGASRSLFGNS